jgi:hypothetical protein
LNDGIYVVHIATDKGAINRRVIVQKWKKY